jgi:O-antigen/teichoic acid export membrane protein
VASILLNVALVPALGGMGAAVAQTFSYAIVATGIVVAAQKICPLQIAWGRLGFALAAVVALAIGMYPAWSPTPVLSLLFKLPVGLLAVAAILKFLAPEVFPLITRRLAGLLSRG